MVQMRCIKCQYLFESQRNGVIVCPNCGERSGVEKEKSADELLKEIGF